MSNLSSHGLVGGARLRPLLAHALVLACPLLGAGCSNSIDRLPTEVDCSVLDGYEFDVLQDFETAQQWYGYGDSTEGGVNSVGLLPLDPPRCGSTQALVLSSSSYDDWGAGFGEYATAMDIDMDGLGYADGSAYVGMSFWARSPGATTKGVSFNVTDRNTNVNGMRCIDADAIVAMGGEGYTTNEGGQQVPVGQELPGPMDCGNDFRRIIAVSEEWQLYRLPFSTFTQDDLPNRQPGGMDTSGIYLFGFVIPKESTIRLELDDIAFYRPVAASAP